MKRIEFYKLQASGNDFVLIDVTSHTLAGTGKSYPSGHRQVTSLSHKGLAKKLCQRKLGIGADGLLVIESSKKADFKMRVFNPDGSEAEMCGNGARCVGLWAGLNKKQRIKFSTKAGIIEAQASKLSFNRAKVKIKVSKPVNLKFNISLKALGRKIKVNFINTGVPHAVVFVEGLNKIDIEPIARAIRNHQRFKPKGTNVNFIEFSGKDSIAIRTYERGLESETLACGTGSIASAIISSYFDGSKLKAKKRIKVKTSGEETLNVSFAKNGNKIDDVWLEGNAHLVYKGDLCV